LATAHSVSIEYVPHRRERAVSQFGEFAQGPAGGVLLDDEGLDPPLNGWVRARCGRVGELRQRLEWGARRIRHAATFDAVVELLNTLRRRLPPRDEI
jgi:hypothetical protein